MSSVVLDDRGARAIAQAVLTEWVPRFHERGLLAVITMRTAEKVHGVTNTHNTRSLGGILENLNSFEPHGHLLLLAANFASRICEGTGWTTHVLVCDLARGFGGWFDAYAPEAPQEETELERMVSYWANSRLESGPRTPQA